MLVNKYIALNANMHVKFVFEIGTRYQFAHNHCLKLNKERKGYILEKPLMAYRVAKLLHYCILTSLQEIFQLTK